MTPKYGRRGGGGGCYNWLTEQKMKNFFPMDSFCSVYGFKNFSINFLIFSIIHRAAKCTNVVEQ